MINKAHIAHQAPAHCCWAKSSIRAFDAAGGLVDFSFCIYRHETLFWHTAGKQTTEPKKEKKNPYLRIVFKARVRW